MAGNSGDSGRSVTARALSVLTAFDADHPRLLLTSVARRAGIPTATAHRLIGELETWGALRRDEDGTYSIGLRLWEIGALSPVNTTLRRTALPFMQQLCETTRETVQLAVRAEFEAVCVECLGAGCSVPLAPRPGDRLPLHPTGVGKVLLAHASCGFVRSYCERGLERWTRYTIIEPGRLGRELRVVRGRGFARTTEEMTLGSCSIAVPIRGVDGTVAAALSVVTGSARADPSKLVTSLLSTAASIGRSLVGRADAEHGAN